MFVFSKELLRELSMKNSCDVLLLDLAFMPECYSNDPTSEHIIQLEKAKLTVDCYDKASLAAVDDDVFRLNPLLQHSLFRMVSSASEKPWRFNLKVPNAFTMVVQHTVSILINNFLIGLFVNLENIYQFRETSEEQRL